MEKENLVRSEEIESRLYDLFKKRLNIEIKDKDELLLGKKIGLSARDLVYICFDIEKEFCIDIDDEGIENYEFTTFSNINDFIISRLKKYKKCSA